MRDVHRLVHRAHLSPPLLGELAAEAGELLRGEGDASHLAFLLSHPMLRDALVAPTIEHADQAHRILRRVAQRTRGEARSNALCLYALAAAACGHSWRVALALHLAVEEAPEHGLSGLLYSVVSRRGAEAMLDAVKEAVAPAQSKNSDATAGGTGADTDGRHR
ncbi:hypothetical protein Cocul_00562 [Corynebacterium oculi]|uniref:DUF4192 domain-containing protein n=1 Tax=Corynebacterium oculi TaxID=1544416 RepID=A0A0Q1AFL6_9CORY|nr:hypothetical protein Cocul_00562 [Corynebacterium oculi]